MKKYLFVLPFALIVNSILAQGVTKNGSVVTDATVSSLKVGTVTYPNTHNATAGQVLTANASGVASWTTPAAGDAFVDLTTAQTLGGLKTFNSNDGFLATGTYGSGANSNLGASTRMMWYPKKAAFRAGGITNLDEWNDSDIGGYSFATGINTTASGLFSTALGAGTIASAERSTAFGTNTTASAYGATAMGDGTTALSYGETTIGFYNTNYTPISLIISNVSYRLFVIGNGNGNSARSNALTVLKNGNTTINGALTAGGIAYPATNGNNGQVLTTNGSGVATWTSIPAANTNLSSGFTGTLPVANGGTGTNNGSITGTGALWVLLQAGPIKMLF